MSLTESERAQIINFLQHPAQKVLLVVGKISAEFIGFIRTHEANTVVIDLKQQAMDSSTLEVVPSQGSVAFIFSNYGEDGIFENLYVTYQLDRWQAKVIIACDKSKLHPVLEPDIYFAPIKGIRVQRHLLNKINLSTPSSDNNIRISSKKPDRPHVSLLEKAKEPLSRNTYLNYFLNRKLMTKDPATMDLLADKVLEDESFKDSLFKIILSSRGEDQLKIAAANAISILNYARIPLSGLDLSGVKIPNADLKWAICHHTNFEGADLRQVNFYQAFLDEAIFTNTDMSNVYIDDDERGSLIPDYHSSIISLDGQHIIIQQGTDSVVWQEFGTRKTIRKMGFKVDSDHSLSRHGNIVFSPNSEQLVIGTIVDYDIKHIEWIDCISHQLIMRFEYSFDRVVFSPDSQYLLCFNTNNNSKSTVYWYNCATQQLIDKIDFNKGITNITFSPDSKQVIFWCGATYDQTYWYDVVTRKKRKLIGDKVMEIYFSSNSKQVVFCGYYGTSQQAHWYDCDSYTLIKEFNDSNILEAKFSQDSNYLIIYSLRGATALCYNCLTRQLILSIDNVRNVYFSLDSKQIIFCCYNETLWYESESRRLLLKIEDNVEKMQFSNDSCQVVFYSTSRPGTMYWYQYDVASQELVANMAGISNILLSPDNQQMVMWGENHFCLVDISKKYIHEVKLAIRNVRYNANQQLIFSTTDCCYIWRRNELDYRLVYRAAKHINSIQSHPLQNAFLCVFDEGGAYWCWDTNVSEARIEPMPRMPPGHAVRIKQMNVQQNDLLFTVGEEGNIWAFNKGQIQHLYHMRNVPLLYLATDSSHVLFSGKEYYETNPCYLYDIKNRKLEEKAYVIKKLIFLFLSKDKQESTYNQDEFNRLQEIFSAINTREDPIDSILFSPDKKYLALYNDNTEGTPCASYLFDFTSGKFLIKDEHNSADVAFSPDSKHVIFYYYNPWSWRRAYWYEIESKQLIKIDDAIRSVLFSPDGNYVVFYNNGVSSAYLYHVHTRQLIMKTKHKVSKVMFSSDSQNVVFHQHNDSFNSIIWLHVNFPDAPVELEGSFEGVLFFDNNRQVIFYNNKANKVAYWCDVKSRKPLLTLQQDFSKIVLSPDNCQIIFHDYSFSKAPAFWYDILTHQLVLKTPAGISEITFSPDSRHIIFYHNEISSGDLYWYDTKTKSLILKLENKNIYILNIVFLFNCKEALFLSIGNSYWIDVATQNILAVLEDVGEKVFLTPDNKYMVIYKKNACCFELSSRKILFKIEDNIKKVEMVKNRYIILHGTFKYFIDLNAMRCGKLDYECEHSTFVPMHSEGIGEDSDNKLHVLTAGKQDNTMRLWDASYVHQPLLKWCSAGLTFSARNVKGLNTVKGLAFKNHRFFTSHAQKNSIVRVNNDSADAIGVSPSAELPGGYGFSQYLCGPTMGNLQCTLL